MQSFKRDIGHGDIIIDISNQEQSNLLKRMFEFSDSVRPGY